MAKLISILLVALVAVIAADTAAIESRAISFFFGPIRYTLENGKACPKDTNGKWVTVGNRTCRCREFKLLFLPISFKFEKCRPASNRTSTTPSPIISTTPVPTPVDPTTVAPPAPADPTTAAPPAPADPTTEAPVVADPTTEAVVVEPTTEAAVVIEPTTEPAAVVEPTTEAVAP